MYRFDFEIETLGLPAVTGRRLPERRFRFGIVRERDGRVCLSIPDRQCDRLEWEPLDRDQADWIASEGRAWLREVWSCAWEFHDEKAFEQFRKALGSEAASGST